MSRSSAQAISAVGRSDVKPALWNPNAAANWSLLFTPAFGAYLQMRNWHAIDEVEKESSAKAWFVASLAMLLVYLVIGVFVEDTQAADVAARGLGTLFLLVWYFSSGRAQSKFVKEKFGKNYTKRPWTKALLLGVGSIVGYWLVAVAIGLVLGISQA